MSRLKIAKIFLISLLLVQLILPVAQAQQPDPVADLLNSMTVEEKVGQLFIVPFLGRDAGPGSDIMTLMTEYKIGGVVLQASNNNFRNDEQTPQNIAALTNFLQAQTLANRNIPLFVAVDHEGDGWPYTRITGGVTPVPSPMSIGATWDPDNARAVGNIVGRELASMGINMVLGPSLDVLNDPRPTGNGDIGTRTFGGDPFWVGELGRAYIQGVHEGSNYTVATVAKHFPGHGGSDRLPDNEVATVDKSLQELKRIELPPFFAVTRPGEVSRDRSGPSGNASPITDALMSSHIRYRGLQGDIRQFTAPISFDVQGMATLLQLPEFGPWRQNGGLIVSDALGVPAVRRYYDPTLQTFPHRRVAREAFLAGNDILILAQFDLRSIWSDQFENIKDTILFFASEYRNNREFAAQVDASVERILRLKFKLFPNPVPNALMVDGEAALAVAGQGQDMINRIAQESLTLLYPPDPEEYKRRLARPPALDEKILIVSDVRQVPECYQEECEPIEPLPYNGIEKIILDLYGPDATRQVAPENVASMSFAELKQVLVGSLAQVNQPQANPDPPASTRSPEEVMQLIQQADWLIFAMLDLNTSRYPASDALKLFLAQGLNSLDKKLIVFALNSPYYLDTTEVNKLTAYFGLYSKTQPHLEVAVKALFGETIFEGASPVTVDGISYELPSILSPDPSRPFPLEIEQLTPPAQEPPVDVVARAGPVLDYNGHPVPDDTPVEFVVNYRTGKTTTVPITHTIQGEAVLTITLTDPGTVEIAAKSGSAESDHAQVIEVVAPPPTPTDTPPPPPSPTETTLPVPSPTPLSTIEPTATPTTEPATPTAVTTTTVEPAAADSPLEPPAAVPIPRVSSGDLLAALAGIFLTTVLGALLWQSAYQTPSQRTRLILVTFIAGMSGYLLYGIGWLRPDLWLSSEAPLFMQRLLLALLVLIFGLLGNLLERRVRGETGRRL